MEDIKPKDYRPRIIDGEIERRLKIYPAISIEGPKWCGKTWTARAHASSISDLGDEDLRKKAEIELDSVMEGQTPHVIDEWNQIPRIWDVVKKRCDITGGFGQYILTCSTKLSDNMWKEHIFHSGAGRYGYIHMRTMSLYETGDSSGIVSLKDIYDGKFKNHVIDRVKLDRLAYFLVRGGWPANLNVPEDLAYDHPTSYIEGFLRTDISEDRNRDPERMKSILYSLARNESCAVPLSKITSDIYSVEPGDDTNIVMDMHRNTASDYLSVLNRLHILEDLPAYDVDDNTSDARVATTPVRHFSDPSLALAVLKMRQAMLVDDMPTFGHMFEGLVIHDLRVYMSALEGEVCYYRDFNTDIEVDAILRFNSKEYAAVEIKLGDNSVEKAKTSLMKFYNRVKKKPKFMMIIVGVGDLAYLDKETGIYVVPLTTLKP